MTNTTVERFHGSGYAWAYQRGQRNGRGLRTVPGFQLVGECFAYVLMR